MKNCQRRERERGGLKEEWEEDKREKEKRDREKREKKERLYESREKSENEGGAA